MLAGPRARDRVIARLRLCAPKAFLRVQPLHYPLSCISLIAFKVYSGCQHCCANAALEKCGALSLACHHGCSRCMHTVLYAVRPRGRHWAPHREGAAGCRPGMARFQRKVAARACDASQAPVTLLHAPGFVPETPPAVLPGQAFGIDGLGLLTISDVPSLQELRDQLLPLADAFGVSYGASLGEGANGSQAWGHNACHTLCTMLASPADCAHAACMPHICRHRFIQAATPLALISPRLLALPRRMHAAEPATPGAHQRSSPASPKPSHPQPPYPPTTHARAAEPTT